MSSAAWAVVVLMFPVLMLAVSAGILGMVKVLATYRFAVAIAMFNVSF